MSGGTGHPPSYLELLPAIYSEDPFLGRLLCAFKTILTGCGSPDTPGIEERIDNIPSLFSPLRATGPEGDQACSRETPSEFLDWLAGWVALGLRADWTEAQKRSFLAEIVPLYRYRGTRDNLAKLLKIYTGLEPVITETGGSGFQVGISTRIGVDTRLGGTQPHFFRVAVKLAKPADKDRQNDILERQKRTITELIDLQKPAHTYYELTIDHETMQIGVRSTIGVNTLLGTLRE